MRLFLRSEDGVPTLAAMAFAVADLGVAGPLLLWGTEAPFLTGELGGSVLSMYSGEMYGPNETRFADPAPADWRAEPLAVGRIGYHNLECT